MLNIILSFFLVLSFFAIPVQAMNFGYTSTPRIMFLGDSITDGTGDTGNIFGYRDTAQSIYTPSSYVTVGAYYSPSSDATYGVRHQGLPGQRADEMQTAIAAQLATYMPKPNPPNSAIVLHIGTNDLNSGGDTGATLIPQLEDIVAQIVAYDPTIKIFVCTILPSTTGALDTKITAYNVLITADYNGAWRSNSNIHLIDANTAFRTCNGGVFSGCMSDILHPNPTGYVTLGTTIGGCILSQTTQYCDGH